jgi:hypothetical protein
MPLVAMCPFNRPRLPHVLHGTDGDRCAVGLNTGVARQIRAAYG